MKKVLIIEDDGDTLEILGWLAEQANVEVVLSPDVLPMSEIKQISPNLILLDYWIGSKRGSELCLEIKQNPETAKIPVVMLSAINEIDEIAKDSLADGSIAKPFDIVQVEELLLAYLG